MVYPKLKSPGWQLAAGEYGDPDLAFFDTVAAAMKRIVRGDVFAAVATSSSQAATGEILHRLTPKGLFHIAGEKDPIVTYALQMETIPYVLSLDGCGTAEDPARCIRPRTARLL